MRYTIVDPTGNITALVESRVEPHAQPGVALQIMQSNPCVEQVGFVRFFEFEPGEAPHVELRMAGGEFCGNATMSAAALYAERCCDVVLSKGAWTNIRCAVSGVEGILEVRLKPLAKEAYSAKLRMPQALSIECVELKWNGVRASVPLVRMPGIYHAIIDEESPFAEMLQHRDEAERVIRSWCEHVGASGLGLMFVGRSAALGDNRIELTPLVYVPASNTVFWENSCASGTSAVGMYLASKGKSGVALRVEEPGGCLGVTCNGENGETWLEGTARIVSSLDG